MRNFVLSSQAVTPAHPDKLSDQISDAMIDAALSGEKPVACIAECAIAGGVVFLSLRHGGKLNFDPAALARHVLASEAHSTGPGGLQPTVMLDLAEVPDLAGISGPSDRVAEHMTTVFGYACDHTGEAMPVPVLEAHHLCSVLETAVMQGRLDGVAPDAQAQVAVRFAERRSVGLTGIALGVFTPEPMDKEDLEKKIRAEVIEPTFRSAGLTVTEQTRIVITPVVAPGGPSVHAGLTGRKSSSDGYGGFCRETGSALSGKHPGRIDRISGYAARQAAVSVVRAGLARECEVQLSYVPGDKGPASLEVDCFGSSGHQESDISAALSHAIDFRLGAIAERLGLWELPARNDGIFYARLARKGHFGRTDMDLPWDRPVPLDV